MPYTILLIPIGSVLYAFRGGRFTEGTTTLGRIVWALFCASLAYYASGNLYAGLGAFLGLLLPHGHYFAMGGPTPNQNDWLKLGKTTPRCWISMAIIGTMRCAMCGIFPLIGLLHPVCYYFGIIKGEYLWGAVFTAGLIVPILNLW